ncbi:MAG: TadE/TadG family type IV pilus assembly protein [Pseudomonadota bacterium]
MGVLRKLLKRYRKNSDGTTAIEFSLMAIPYIFLTIAIFEISIMYASASLLEGATTQAARQIRTGQIQQAQSGDPEQLFRDSICDYATVLVNCNDVVVEAIQLASFSDFDSAAAQYDADGNLVSQGFDPGGSEARVLIRVGYRYEMMVPLVGTLLAGPTNSRLFMSTIVMQSEPYDFDGAG